LEAYLVATRASQTELLNQAAQLRQQMDQQQKSIQKLIEPTRKRLLEQAKQKSAAGEQVVPQPIARWEFETDLKDVVGAAHGEARGGAKVEAGSLVVNQQAHVITAPLTKTLKAKTLEAWVQLDNLDQRAGGVMTIQTPDGNVFDAIVFAEQNPRQWMAGSNGFARTQPFNAPQDQDAASRAVHVAITYHDDGLIAGYRDGQPYGKPYKSSGPFEFVAGKATIGFGIRHLPAGGNRMLAGKILRAQLYDRALTADEIQATSMSAPYFVSEAQVLAELTAADREQIDTARQRLKKLESEIESLGTIPESLNDKAVWTDLAHSLLTFQEFIYLR
jgi:TolA-binding protein